MTPLETLHDLRFGDVQTFLAVKRWASITGAARALHVTPSQVSKAIARLEDQLGSQLLARGARGVTLTASGLRAVTELEEVVRRVETLRMSEAAPELTIAAPAFLTSLFLTIIAERRPHLRVRAIELPPTLVRVYAAENVFDLALSLGEERFPEGWIATRIGDVKKSLYASPTLAKKLSPNGGPVDRERIADIPFITPIYNHSGKYLVSDDGCPIGAQRKIGHEVQTMAMALELAARTDQLVFGAEIFAKPWVARGQVVEVRVREWNVVEPLYVTCNGERMRASDQKELVGAIGSTLAALNA